MATCPFCRSDIHDEAVVCRGCGARQAYYFQEGRFYSKGDMTSFGIVLPVVFAIIPFVLIAVFRVAAVWAVTAALLWAAIMAIPIIFSIKRVNSGPRWFR
jgi:hypothetical protein